jgi:histidine ammonia-lyase
VTERGGTVTVDGPADLDRELIWRLAVATRRVRLAPALVEHVEARRAQLLAVLEGGDPVYGVTTGMGALSGVGLDERAQRSHQRNLLLARAVGGPPWLDRSQVRALVAVRLRTFLGGDSGVSAALCQRLVEWLNSGVTPAVPRTGSGAAGEIIPLAHAFGPLVGVGSLLGPAGAVEPAGGIAPLALGPKEGVALLAGVPGTTGQAVVASRQAGRLLLRMTEVAAAAIAVAGAPRDPYQEACGRGDPLLAARLGAIRRLAAEEPSPRMLQAPVSFRVAGHVLAHVERTLAALEAAIDRALEGVTDSPAFLGGRLVGTAGFHGIDLAAHCDHLTAALAHAAEVSTARLHGLLDARVTGLPSQLARDPGPQTGLVTVHKRAAGVVHALRRAAIPAAVGLVATSQGQEDVQSFAWEAAQQLGEAIDRAREVTACELLAVFQAFALSERQVPEGLRPLLELTAAAVPPIESDRPFGEDIGRLVAALGG